MQMPGQNAGHYCYMQKLLSKTLERENDASAFVNSRFQNKTCKCLINGTITCGRITMRPYKGFCKIIFAYLTNNNYPLSEVLLRGGTLT